MLNKMIGWVAKLTIGRSLVGLVNSLNEKMTGKRTEIIISLQAVIYLLSHFNILPKDSEEVVSKFSLLLLGALPVTVAEKMKKVAEIAETVIPKPEAKEEEKA